MFGIRRTDTIASSAASIASLVYHNTVRSIRKGHSHAAVSLLNNLTQSLLFVAVFYVLFDILGMRGSVIRGDFLLFVMSGIFLFLTHTKAKVRHLR